MRYSPGKIKARREEIDLTQREVSNRSKVTVATISSIENGHKYYVREATMNALAKALKTDVAELLEHRG